MVGVLIFLERTQEIPRHKGFLEVYRFGEKGCPFQCGWEEKKCGRIGCWIQFCNFFGPALTISLLLLIATLAFISCFTFLNVILSFLQALTIPLLLLVATLSSANTGGFFAYNQQMDFTLRGNYRELTFCRDKNNGRFKTSAKMQELSTITMRKTSQPSHLSLFRSCVFIICCMRLSTS